MTIPVQNHPQAEQLLAFRQGTLRDEAEFLWISLHLESCSDCLRALEGMSSDTLEKLARAAQTPDNEAPSLVPSSQLTTEFCKSEPAADEAEDLNFLAPSQQDDEIGRLGPYRVLKILGVGGMGIVFQAEDISLKRRVALKVMKPQAAAHPYAKERFLREARAAAALEDDHIVVIHQVGEEGGVPFLAMQWLQGMSLEDRLRGKGGKAAATLNVRQIVRIGRQIAQGLTVAHEHGLIHRDIKPANLWLTPEQGGRLKILDFGLALALNDDAHLTQQGAIVGTPAYMAPEQARGEAVEPRCDLFSLGVVLYRLTTGRLPFRGANTMAVLSSLATDEPEPPGKLASGMPAELSDLIMKLLSKEPAQRPATARLVDEALLRIDRQLSPSASGGRQLPGGSGIQGVDAPRSPVPATRPSRKQSVYRGLAAVGMLALLTAAAVFFLQTPKSTLRVEINDASIEAILRKDGAVIKGTDKAHDIRLSAGEHALKIKRGDLEFETDKFILKKGDKVTLNIELLPGKIQVVRDGKVIGEKALPTAPLAEVKRPSAPVAVDERAAAAWVLSRGGTVFIRQGVQQTSRIFRVTSEKLPLGHWTLWRIDCNGEQKVNDADLKKLAGLKDLVELNLDGQKVTDAGLKELAELQNLQVLHLSGTDVTGVGMKYLAELPNLTQLWLGAAQLNDEGMKEIVRLKHIEFLILNLTPVTETGLRELGKLKSVRRLYLQETQVTDAVLRELAGLDLTILNIRGAQVTETGLKELAKIKNLQLLCIACIPATTDAVLKELAGLKQLHNLEVYDTRVTDAGLKHLTEHPNLHTLSINGTRVTDAGLIHLAEHKNLSRLILGGLRVTNAGLKHVAELKNLHWLALNQTLVTDAGLKHLTGLPKLQSLDLNNTRVTDAGLKQLAGFPKLQKLDLDKTSVTKAGREQLRKARPTITFVHPLPFGR